MATDVAHPQAGNIGEINKYDFRTESKYIFKAARESTRRSSGRSRT